MGIWWKRVHRLGQHLTGTAPVLGIYPRQFLWRLLEALLLLADCLLIPELLVGLNRLFKPNTRCLTEREVALAYAVFGESIDYRKVRVDQQARIGCRRHHFAYVGFNLINCWGPLSDAHFIHEMVHVWQFQQGGSVYIPRALWAQRTKEGYNYGGSPALIQAVEAAKGLAAFNYEQQGDVVADYFRLKKGEHPAWSTPEQAHLPLLEAILKNSLIRRI